MAKRVHNPYLRVTEVCSFVNSEWYKYWVKSTGSVDECERISKESREFGTGVHNVAENHLIGTPLLPTLTDRQRTCGGYLTRWLEETKAKPITLGSGPAVECELVSDKFMFKGHPDLICTFGDSPVIWVADWKSSKEMRLEYKLQMAAYAMAISEMYNISIDHGTIVRVPSDPNVFPQFETHEVHGLLTEYWPVFKSCLEVVQYFKKKGKWKGT